MPNWKKVITSGSDASLNSIYSVGPITGSDVKINDWGSVSASLASLDASTYNDSDVTDHISSLGVVSGSSQITISDTTGYIAFSSSIASDIAAIDSNVTLQEATDNGSTTTNNINLSGSSQLFFDDQHGLSINNSARSLVLGSTDTSSIDNSDSIAIGEWANKTTNGYQDVVIGSYASYFGNNNGGENVFLGYSAAARVENLSKTVAVGAQAMGFVSSNGNDNTAIGYYAARQFKGDWTTFVGTNAGALAGNGTLGANVRDVVGVGAFSGHNIEDSYNTAIGAHAAYESTALSGQKNTFLGYNASYGTAGSITNSTAIGADVTLAQSNTVILGNNASVGIKTSTPSKDLEVAGEISGSDVYIDDWGSVSASLASIDSNVTLQEATDNGNTTTNNVRFENGISVTGSADISGSLAITGSISSDRDAEINSITIGRGSNSTDYGSTAIGYQALLDATSTADNNTAVGADSMRSTTTGTQNTAIGRESLYLNESGDDNVALGAGALRDNVSGDANVAVGRLAAKSITGNSNIAVGRNTLTSATSAGNNTAIGDNALFSLTTSGGNVALGKDAGRKRSGGSILQLPSASVFLGAYTKAATTSGTNEIVIGYEAEGNGSNTVTIGNSNITDNYFSGNISGSDTYIDDWGSVSASLAALEVSSSTANQNLQEVTNNGQTTSRDIILTNTSASFRNSSGNLSNLEHNKLGFTLDSAGTINSQVAFGTLNSLTSSFYLNHNQPVGGVLHPYGSFDLNVEPSTVVPSSYSSASFKALQIDHIQTQLGHNQVVSLFAYDRGITNATSSGISIYGPDAIFNQKKLVLTNITEISSSGEADAFDVYIKDWGSVSASLATLESSANPTLQDVTNNGSTTTNAITSSDISIDDWGSVSASLSSLSSTIGGSGFVDVTGTPTSNQLAIYSDSNTIKSDTSFKVIENQLGRGSTYNQWDGDQVDLIFAPGMKAHGIELGDLNPASTPFTASLTIHTNHGATSNSVEKTAHGHQYVAGTHVVYTAACSSVMIHYNLLEDTAVRSGQLVVAVYGNEASLVEHSTSDIGTGDTTGARFTASASSGTLTLSIVSAAGGSVSFSAERMYSV